jgi:hypothetical protein
MILAHRVLMKLGATLIFSIVETDDPETEEEFNELKFESPEPITWEQYQQKYQEIKDEEAIRILRGHQKALLESTDWIMTVDNFQSLSNKEQWVAYRQMLRDLPTNHPPIIWKDLGVLDLEKMGILPQPPILRLPTTE